MTDEQIKAALTEVIEEAIRTTSSASIVLSAKTSAAAVFDLVKPKPLIWMRNSNHWAGGRGYVVRKMGSRYTLTIRNQFDQQFDELEAAQAAAQAHADAAHWANITLAEEVY